MSRRTVTHATGNKGVAMPVRLEVWGRDALFTRPESKAERVSYDVMTPSAARGVLEAVYWHPGMHWRVDRIHVLNPIRMSTIRRNELDTVIGQNPVQRMMDGGGTTVMFSDGHTQQRSSTILTDVRYVIDAHFTMDDEDPAMAAKHQSMFKRRANKGQCHHRPYLGCREFPAEFRPWAGPDDPIGFETGERDLGIMFLDFDYTDPDRKPLFFPATLVDGTLTVPSMGARS